MVPIFINGIPVPLANDAYPIAIITSFAIHHYFPILREVMKLSNVMMVRSKRDNAMFRLLSIDCFSVIYYVTSWMERHYLTFLLRSP